MAPSSAQKRRSSKAATTLEHRLLDGAAGCVQLRDGLGEVVDVSGGEQGGVHWRTDDKASRGYDTPRTPPLPPL
ncbi:MAG TPA: hypothetical protein VLS92_10175 [Acidimicrobiia bacterium]|nr:hypothetical protein [Acidimicrobiia bacterium]